MQDKQLILLKARQIGKSYLNSKRAMESWYIYRSGLVKKNRIKSIKNIFNI